LNEIEDPRSNAVSGSLNLLDFAGGKALYFTDMPAFIYLRRKFTPKKQRERERGKKQKDRRQKFLYILKS